MRSKIINRRIFSATNNPCRNLYNTPRVRFAPSPTGYLHLGGLRTALYNYLFAKSRQGSFVLRIEDTDQKRKVAGAVELLIKDLKWAGIELDEGPGMEGKYGPYVQSERLQIYKEHINKLLDNESAYRCFCTERRLNMLRRDAMKHQRVPKYDNRCRNLTELEVKEKIKNGIPYCIRFKLSSDCQSFEDMIFGGIAYDVSMNEGDPVLMKSDGYPTYHFANVVDDHLMEITHVLRGVEWQISTTKHLLIYRAFGWSPPQFGHLPLIINSDGTKLSKRQGDVTVEDYKKKGTFPLALVNYITLSGGGFEHVPGAGVTLKTMDELGSEFQINKILSHPSRLNPDLLQECNRLEIKRQLKEPHLSQILVNKVQKLVKEKFPNENMNISDDHVRNVLNWATARVSNIDELVSTKFGFLWILPSSKIDLDKELLEKLLKNLENFEKFEQDLLKNNLREFSVNNNVKFPVLMKMLRGVLSGLGEGPGVAEMMHLLGKVQSLERIKAVLR
ncbi:nondiscriminating glutamyl-tRNA synthetase EARS2, mitochondrial [Plodia interpunctella]|uniref:nondiscriminating glutamyl-tRNA synthetase EARS2, mitochondrial n=1 Tax=Plodia interpunctella TaxID=58824 RepID=UPI002367993E|nr:probable glutamate--tRNA ligase, mitochondrial [Plodia interpunctella]